MLKLLQPVVVLREQVKEEKTKSGIVIAGQEPKEYGSIFCEVLLTRKGCEADVKKGDIVIVEKTKCQEVSLKEFGKVLMCPEEDILGKVGK